MNSFYRDLENLLDQARKYCKCGCRYDSTEARRRTLQKSLGCLQAAAVMEALLLIAHGFADGAGADDASNLFNLEDSFPFEVAQATLDLLYNLATLGTIFWDRWYRIVCSIVTGESPKLGIKEHPKFHIRESSLLHWTSSPMTITPVWFALDQTIDLQGSWGINVHNGCIPDLEAESAAVYSIHNYKGVDSFFEHPERPPPPTTIIEGGSIDDSNIEIFSSVVDNDGSDAHYMLYCAKIRSSDGQRSALRDFDPGNIYKAHLHSLMHSNCGHYPQESSTWIIPGISTARDVILVDLVELFRHEYSQREEIIWDRRPVQVFLLANDPLKQNLAIGWNDDPARIGDSDTEPEDNYTLWSFCSIIQGEKCCFGCLIDKADKYQCPAICARIDPSPTFLTQSPPSDIGSGSTAVARRPKRT